MGASSMATWHLRRQMAWTAHLCMENVRRLGRDGVLPPGAIVAVVGSTSDNKVGRETTKMCGKAVEDFQSGRPRMPRDRVVAKKVNRRFQRVTSEDT